MKKNDLRRILIYISAVLVAEGSLRFAVCGLERAGHWTNTGDKILEFLGTWLVSWCNGWLMISPFCALNTIALVYLLVCLVRWLIERFIKKVAPETKNVSEKAGKIGFALSFLPLVIFLGLCTYTGIVGTDGGFFTSPKHGWDAFFNAFIWGGLLLCVVPVFPTMLVIQIVHIVGRRKRRSVGMQGDT